jgi:hypothetical protein
VSRLARLAVVLAVASLPVLLFPDVVARAAALYHLADSANPWFLPGHAALLYGAVPLVVLSAIALLLAPGLLLTLALGRSRNTADWLLHGFVISVLVVSGAAAAVQAVLARPLRGTGFTVTTLGCAALGLAVAWLRVRRSPFRAWPLDDPYARATLLLAAAAPWLLCIVLTPKFLWEAFNGDGAHAFESARLLLHHAVPFWDPAAGEIAGFPGMTSMLFTYPASWFIRLFGEWEVAARLPLLLFLPPLSGGLVALIGEGRARAPDIVERGIIWLAIAVYVVAISFSASYSPYSADIALPATQDTLLVLCFFGFVLSFLRHDWWFAALFALFTHLSLPNGFLLLAFWLVAASLVWRRARLQSITIGTALLVGCVLFTALAPRLLSLTGARPPGGEYGLGALLLRFAFLQVTDVRRLLFLILPCGVIPAFSLLLWRRQDAVARAFTLVTLAAFLFAFVQLHAPLHYYIPAMLLPLVVFWRIGPAEGRARSAVLGATAAAALGALLLSWPAGAQPFTASRVVGMSIDDRIGGYDVLQPEQLRASTLIRFIVPYDWDARVPDASLGGSPVAFNVYAHRDAAGPRNYILQRAGDAAPAGATLVQAEDGFAIYVRDHAVWRSHLSLRPATPAGSMAYFIPRGILFRSVPLDDGPFVIDLPALATRLGIDVNAVAARLGIGSEER